MHVKGKIYRAIVLSTLLYGAEDSVQTTGEKAACLHDATSAFDHEETLDGQSDKQGHTRTDRVAIYGKSSDQKESPVDRTPHKDVPRQAPKAESQLSTVFWSQKERTLSSPVQGYHQEKPEAERHKDRLMDITLTAEIYVNSQVNGSSLCRIATDSMMMITGATLSDSYTNSPDL